MLWGATIAGLIVAAVYLIRTSPQPSPSSMNPTIDMLLALRRQPSGASEAILLRACSDFDPNIRAAAVSGFGWWDPIHREPVSAALTAARRDRAGLVRFAAEAALGRLGERTAISRLQAALAIAVESEDADAVCRLAEERVSWLWPELAELAALDEPGFSGNVAAALEQWREEIHMQGEAA